MSMSTDASGDTIHPEDLRNSANQGEDCETSQHATRFANLVMKCLLCDDVKTAGRRLGILDHMTPDEILEDLWPELERKYSHRKPHSRPKDITHHHHNTHHQHKGHQHGHHQGHHHQGQHPGHHQPGQQHGHHGVRHHEHGSNGHGGSGANGVAVEDTHYDPHSSHIPFTELVKQELGIASASHDDILEFLASLPKDRTDRHLVDMHEVFAIHEVDTPRTHEKIRSTVLGHHNINTIL